MATQQPPEVRAPVGEDDEPGMWQQFRRRRVIRTVLLYLMLAFAAAEATLYLGSRFDLRESAVRAVFGVLVLGFPLTVVLAWSYDVTPGGIVKTPEEWTAQRPPAPGGRYGWLIAGSAAVAVGLVLRALRN